MCVNQRSMTTTEDRNMSNKKPLIWSDVAGHPVVVCPNCEGKSEAGSDNYYSLKSRGICEACHRKEQSDVKDS